MNRSRGKLPPGQKNRLPTRVMVQCPRRYWTAAAFVIGTGTAFVIAAFIVGDRVHILCYFCNASKSFFYRHGAERFFRLDVADLLQMGGAFMKSLVIKRSVVVAGHKTSVSLEDAFWKGLKGIAGARNLTLSELVGAIDSEREYGNLSSALRLFVLEFYRSQISDLKEGRDGPDQGSESSGAVRIKRMA